MYTEKGTQAAGAIVSTAVQTLGARPAIAHGEEVAEDVAEGSEGPSDIRTR